MSIERIRNWVNGVQPGGTGSVRDLPTDHKLVFNRSASEQWKFKDGHVLLNDEDIEDIINEERNNVRLQTAVSEALHEYRLDAYNKGAVVPDFLARIEAIQGKILSNLGRIWDEMSGGIRLTWGDGGYLLNHVNVRAVLAMYHSRPTSKAKKFLEGLKHKLALILVNKNGSPHYERLNNVVKKLYDEVEVALSVAPMDTANLRLTSGTSRG